MRGSVLFLFLGVLLVGEQALAQKGDTTFSSKIRSVKLFRSGDPVSYPMITLNSNEQLELHFDDLDGDVKFYYYSLIWAPIKICLISYR